MYRLRVGEPEAVAIPGLDFSASINEDGQTVMDQAALSHDGEVLIHRRHVAERCNDTMCGTEATFTLADLDTARVLGTAPSRPNPCCGDPGPLQYLEGAGRGHTLLLEGVDRETWVLDEKLSLQRLENSAPLHLFSDGASALLSRREGRGHALHRVRLADQSVVQSLGETTDVVVSRRESFVVGSRFEPDKCVRYPDRPGVCHKQIWQLVAWHDKNERVLAESTQPLGPVWVGEDGSVLVAAQLADHPLPDVADPAVFPEEPAGIHLLDPSGTRIATLSGIGSVRGLWEAQDALIIASWGKVDGEWTLRLHAVNPRSGATRLLVHGDEIEVHFDQSRTRLACWVESRGKGETQQELWAGAVPVP
jgi:hypothetical protein